MYVINIIVIIIVTITVIIIVIIISIADAPEIVEKPKTVRARAGEDVSFRCKVSLTRTMM